MADITLSPFMNMPVPNVGIDPGPDWANNVNACISIIDGHDHALGTGNQINPNGININTDLPFNNNNAISLRSVRFTPQGAAISDPSDLGTLYEVGVDLYYNDGSGNQVRITQGGSVTGASGTITGLPSGTASASFAAGTFTFQSATNTAATIDAGTYILRKLTSGSNGISLQAPNAISSDYAITFPLLPASPALLAIDTSGNVSTLPYPSLPSGSPGFVRVDSAGNTNFIAMYDIVVGPGGDYSTIGAAITAASSGQSILILRGTYSENVTVNKVLNISGNGRGTIINGSLTFASGSSDSLMKDFKVSGVTINSGVSEIQVVEFWNATGFSITDNGDGSYIQGMQE